MVELVPFSAVRRCTNDIVPEVRLRSGLWRRMLALLDTQFVRDLVVATDETNGVCMRLIGMRTSYDMPARLARWRA